MRQRPRKAVFGPSAGTGAKWQAKALRDDLAGHQTRRRLLEPRCTQPLHALRLPGRLPEKRV